jgi:hypothetical protein
MAQSPEAAAQAMINNLQANTGKTLPQWFAVLKKTNFAKNRENIKNKKGEQDYTHGSANMKAN